MRKKPLNKNQEPVPKILDKDKVEELQEILSQCLSPTTTDMKKMLGLKSALLTQVGLQLLKISVNAPRRRDREISLAMKILQTAGNLEESVAKISLEELKLELKHSVKVEDINKGFDAVSDLPSDLSDSEDLESGIED